jgi:hypothetical protein
MVELNQSNFPDKAKSDGSDLRFAEDGKELSYWIEDYDAGAKTARIWVKVPKIPANEETKIKMYYSNEKTGSVSDGNAVFVLFDDFEGTSLDTSKWESFNLGKSGSLYVSGGYLVMEGGDHYDRGIKSKIIVSSNGKEMRGKYWIEMSI